MGEPDSLPVTLALAALLLLSGCDFFGGEEDTTIRATGTVIFAETGEPIGGLGVVFRRAGGVGSSIFVRARTTTAADGSFELVHDGGEGAAYVFRINDDPYDGRYSTFSRPIRAGETEDFGVIELPRGQQ
jgi:hypothetical protein